MVGPGLAPGRGLGIAARSSERPGASPGPTIELHVTTVDSMAAKLGEDEERALIDALAGVIQQVGVERFLTRPIVMPDERHFPDAWEHTPLGVARLFRRMLRFAGLPHAHKIIATSDALVSKYTAASGWTSTTWRTAGSPVQLAGVQSGAEEPSLVLIVDPDHLDDADFVVGSIAREVARAFRTLDGLHDPDSARDEKLVDVTAVALGFGVLVANNAFRVRSKGEIRGNII